MVDNACALSRCTEKSARDWKDLNYSAESVVSLMSSTLCTSMLTCGENSCDLENDKSNFKKTAPYGQSCCSKKTEHYTAV